MSDDTGNRGHHYDCPKYHTPGHARDVVCEFHLCEMSPGADRANCMVCDLYAVIDRHGDPSSDFVAGLVSVLPPRGHGMHQLGVWEQTYRTPARLT